MSSTVVKHGAPLSKQFPCSATRIEVSGFTILEILVSVSILAILVVMFSHLLSSATAVTTFSNKRTEADAQARAVFDRMAIDFGRMVKRPDVDYFLKSSTSNLQSGQDQMAFYSEVPGYYPPSGSQSPLSLIGYRINGSAGAGQSRSKLQRLGYGLLWNGASLTNAPTVFLPLTIAATWPTATNLDPDDNYELMGPQVFRYEYYYILRGQTQPALPVILSDTPWDERIPNHTSVSGLRDVAAIGVAIAVIDPRSKALVTDEQLEALAGAMKDFTPGMQRGALEAQWQAAIDDSTSGIPKVSAASIRVYSRQFYLKPQPLLP